MHFITEGQGKPLLLVHGIGSNGRIWRPLLAGLAQHREVIILDLPGHGQSPETPGSATFAGLAADCEAFLDRHGFGGIDMAGFSLGGRLVLELARRGLAGAVVALAPGGFWAGWERAYLYSTLLSSVTMLHMARGLIPAIAAAPMSRAAVMGLLSAHPLSLDAKEVEAELFSYTGTTTLSRLVHDLTTIPQQEGPSAPATRRVTIGWGRHDRLCFPVQAERARATFPESTLHWFEKSGHYMLWDEPDETIRLILEGCAE